MNLTKPISNRNRYRTPGILLIVLAICMCGCATEQRANSRLNKNLAVQYFDPHNHLDGIVGWQIYANPPAYLKQLQGDGPGPTRADKLALYRWLSKTWLPAHSAKFADKPFSSTLRFGIGARATLHIYPATANMPLKELNSALQRILTATPFTEFDSAYAFKDILENWDAQHFYHGNMMAAKQALNIASVLRLAQADITGSEQSIGFIGGWDFNSEGRSPLLQTILIAAGKNKKLNSIFAQAGLTKPQVRILLMTHTNQLAENIRGDQFKTFDKTGKCHWEPLNPDLKLSPQQMYLALLGKNKQGKNIIPDGKQNAFFNTVVGIDTAAPEMTCFTRAGMAYYQKLVDAVYRASKKRRVMGYHGKLIVHTHVGEGFSEYYAKNPPAKPWRFDSTLAKVPAISGNIVTNTKAPVHNITMLLETVTKIRKNHPDIDQYMIIRFGHVTHATLSQAKQMAKLHIEADINLDSNIATGAWSFNNMPDSNTIKRKVALTAKNPATNFNLNNLSKFLIPNPDNTTAVSKVLGTHPLKYMLIAHVRVMLGTDGRGVEYSPMPRQYALAGALIKYWEKQSSQFKQTAGSITSKIFFTNAAWHINNRQSNKVFKYSY